MAIRPDHKQTIQEEFSKQAHAYAASSSVADPDRIDRLIQATHPTAAARVLEVATGPGYVALGFAAVCHDVVGLDLTPAVLDIAERQRHQRGLSNLRFQLGDADHLPFADGEFDIVVCRFAFHHFTDTSRVLREMTRVCRPNGTIAVEDLVTSEHPERSAYQNHFEQLRDPSHVYAYPLSRLISLFTTAGLELDTVYTDVLIPTVEQWLATAHTPPARAEEVRTLIERDAIEDLSGTRPFHRDGALCFTQHTAALLGRRLRASQVG